MSSVRLGFQFVPFPREIWTENIDLTQAEFRLLGWFCCNLKFGFSQIEVSDYQVLQGFRSDDSNYPPVGLSKNSLRRARAGLIDHGMLLASQHSQGGGRGKEASWVYSLNLSNSDRFPDKPIKVGTETLPTLTLNPPNFDPKPSQLGPALKEEEETERTEETELILTPPSAADGNSKSVFDIQKLFTYFTLSAKKSKTYTLTPKRKKMAESRWKEVLKISNGDIIEAKLLLKHAIDAVVESKFLQAKGLVEWEQVFKSEDNFSKWLDRYENEVA